MFERLGRWSIASSAFAFSLLGIAANASATPSAKLTYLRGAGAEQCPDEAELKKAVAARLGYDVFFPWARTTVVAEISRAPKGFNGRVKVVDEHALVRGERAIASASNDCSDVMRALALAISIAVDDFGIDDVPLPPAETARPGEIGAREPPATAPADVRPPPATGRPADVAERSSKPSVQRARIGFAAWLAPIVSFGVAPSGAAGAHVDLEARYRLVSLGLEARGDLPASATTPVGGRVSTHLFAGSIAPCLRAPSLFFGCGLVSIGDFRASGSGIAAPRSDQALFAAAGGRLGVELPLSTRFFFVAHADALATLTRHVVQIDGLEAFTIAPVTASFGLGAGARF